MSVYNPYDSNSEMEKDSILLRLWERFPEYMSKQELTNQTGIEKDKLDRHLVYLEDQNFLKKEADRFRITAQGIDHQKERSKQSSSKS